jgi:hypothetical protein
MWQENKYLFLNYQIKKGNKLIFPSFTVKLNKKTQTIYYLILYL